MSSQAPARWCQLAATLISINFEIAINLKEEKATGPDQLAARLLRRCAKEFSLPVAKLARAMLKTGRWPKLWRTHWVMPLYKNRRSLMLRIMGGFR